MTDVQPQAQPESSSDIALTDIDALLEAEDPKFASDLKDVAKIESAKDVVIDGSADVADVTTEKIEEPPKGFKGKLKAFVKNLLFKLSQRLKNAMVFMGHEFWAFLKVRPKEFAIFLFKVLKILLAKAYWPLKAFQEATGLQKLATLLLIGCIFVGGWVLLANMKRGVWIPQLNEPVLSSFEAFAYHVEEYDPKVEGESFYSAFPQERHEYLFPKIKVNLSRTDENPNPMGAFEVIVLLDSKDTAIEVADRKVEFFDLLQRVLEDQTFAEFESELGKGRVKSEMKRELNAKLTQGWVKDINFKTLILKP